MPIGMFPYVLVFRKVCHLLLELEHKMQWALKKLNLDIASAGKAQKLQLNKLAEWQFTIYENAKLYKERTKWWNGSRICKKDLVVDQRVLLFNSHLRLFPSKLKSRWPGPFVVHEVFPHGAMELMNKDGSNAFKINGPQVKPYYGGSVDRDKETIDLGRQA
ncbi:uncharacterized protein LOC120079214 [Benincasa hispida]|uniref:uncharacterized protein LOC120079214 n=1 Tax=Benincasa hispida TaxID=102211 RepID=UPI001902BB41|nr:uncharacterized protein LOC120079214 [Benincasa hispida]